MPLVILAAAIVVGGAIGAVSQFVLEKGLWVWEMPDLAHRFLAAGASAYVVGGAIVLTRRRAAAAQMLAAIVLMYGYPLVLAILIDSGSIDWGEPIAWAFVIIVTPAVIVGTLYLLRTRTPTPSAPEQATTTDAPTRALLMFLAIVPGILGALVFVAPNDVDALWPWAKLDAWETLDHRLLALMLLTIAGGAGLALRRNDAHATALLLGMVIAYCVVAAAGLAIHAADTPALAGEDTVYITILALVGLATAVALARGARLSPDPPILAANPCRGSRPSADRRLPKDPP